MKIYKEDTLILKTQKYKKLIHEFYKLKSEYQLTTGLVPDTIEVTQCEYKIILDYLETVRANLIVTSSPKFLGLNLIVNKEST